MANEEAKKTSKKRNLTKKQTVLYSYIGVLAVVTVLFGYNLLNYFYLDPMKAAGQPVYGYRTEKLEPISDAIISKAKEVGSSQSGVKEVSIKVQGPLVYFDIRVNDGVDVQKARAAAEAAANEFLSQAGDIANNYTLQLITSVGDIKELATKNREEELAYIKQHDIAIIELIVANAEKYPTAANIQRAKDNINLMPQEYSQEATVFNERIKALKELTAEEEEALGEIPYLEVDQTIKPTDISSYPSWGVYDKTTKKFIWQ